MWYQIEREKNIFKVINIHTDSISITLFFTESCDMDDNYEICQSEVVLLPGEEHTFILPDTDGLYKLVVTTEQEQYQYQQTYIPQYNKILSSLIEDMEYILCGCHCIDCEDCDGQEEDVLPVFLKMLSYILINKNKYEKTLTNSAKCIECEILNANLCYILHENIQGNAENKRLMKQIIAYYYLVFYYTDLLNENDERSIQDRYNFKKIYSCIKRLGLSIECIKINAESYS